MALFSTFLLSNNDSSLLFNYRFPTLAINEMLVRKKQDQPLDSHDRDAFRWNHYALV